MARHHSTSLNSTAPLIKDDSKDDDVHYDYENRLLTQYLGHQISSRSLQMQLLQFPFLSNLHLRDHMDADNKRAISDNSESVANKHNVEIWLQWKSWLFDEWLVVGASSLMIRALSRPGKQHPTAFSAPQFEVFDFEAQNQTQVKIKNNNTHTHTYRVFFHWYPPKS